MQLIDDITCTRGKEQGTTERNQEDNQPVGLVDRGSPSLLWDPEAHTLPWLLGNPKQSNQGN